MRYIGSGTSLQTYTYMLIYTIQRIWNKFVDLCIYAYIYDTEDLEPVRGLIHICLYLRYIGRAVDLEQVCGLRVLSRESRRHAQVYIVTKPQHFKLN